VSASIADAVVESVTTLFPTPTVPPAPNDVQVWDGEVRGVPANRYVQVVVGNEVRSASSVDAVARDYLSRFTVQCVATNPNSNFPVTALARNLGRKVRDHLVGRTLTVDGLVVGLIVHETSEGPFKDDDVADRPVMFVVDEYAVLATA
jgi:hypothetical protein